MNEPRFSLTDVDVCDHCGHAMIPNVSSEDQDGLLWICMTYDCAEFNGQEIEAEDLIAVGCPEWVANRFEDLASGLMGFM